MSDSGCMKLPFNATSIKNLIINNETGDGGYYPFGSSQFWHAGLHLHTSYEDKSVVDAILPGQVVSYRICENYVMVPLPKVIFDESLKQNLSKYIDLYEPKTEKIFRPFRKNGSDDEYEMREVIETHYYMKKDVPEEKQKIEYANGFILLKHEFNIPELEKPLVFYTFYMNLAAKSELSVEDKKIYDKFICDGEIHYLNEKRKERFEINKIGAAGLNNAKRYIEIAVIQKESLFSYRINKKLQKEQIRKIFYSAKNINDFYTRKKTDIQSKITVLPKYSVLYVQDEIRSGEKTAKKVCFKKIAVYLPTASMDKPKSGDKKALLIDVKSATVYTTKYTNENFPAIEEVRSATESQLKKGAEFSVMDMSGTQPLIRLGFTETKSFWIIDGTNGLNLPEIEKQYELENSILDIPVYDECPIYSEFTKNKDTSIDKDKITGFSNLVYLDKNKTCYYELLNQKNVFVKADDSEHCYVCPFEWGKFFHDETSMEGGLFCDRTHLFTKYDKTGLLKDLYMTNAEHDYITEDELHLVYGNKGDFQGASELREEIRKVVCRHAIEFDESLFNNIHKEWSKHKDWGCHYLDKNMFSKSLQITEVWRNGLQKEFKKNELYFVHPFYFFEHLQKAVTLTFNPYYNFTYDQVHGGSIGKNVDKEKLITDNPGFAPVWSDCGRAPNPNINGFAAITGFFNEDYADENHYTQYDNYYHEGVDFRGTVGTDIVSFICGRVLAYGYFGPYGRAIFVEDFGSKGIYLLGHLNSYNNSVLDTGLVKPGDIVGKVGTSGEHHPARIVDGISQPAGYDYQYDPHLHVTYLSDVIKDYVYVLRNSTTNSIDTTKFYNDDFRAKRRNPFIHNSEPQQKHVKRNVKK